MQKRKLKIVKLTPIALAVCERCNATFQSYRRGEDEAEREMKALFERHDCELAETRSKEAAAGKEKD
jgi:NMD protein affecting ribosome stability and mRNA decay